MQTDQLEFVEATGELPLPETLTHLPPPVDRLPLAGSRLPRSFAGFRLTTIALVVVIIGLTVWNAWMTRELVALKRHRLVSVSLASMITDFVQAQAHAQGYPDDAAMRTKLYLVATQKALIELAKDGTPVIASEAVLGNSVPDDTAVVKASVARAMAAEPGQH